MDTESTGPRADGTRRASQSVKAIVERALKMLAPLGLPLLRPLAWRTRTFMARSVHDVEIRSNAMLGAIETTVRTHFDGRISATEANLAARLDDLMNAMRARDITAERTAREQRLLHTALRRLVEDSELEIRALRADVASLEARIADSGPNT